MMNGKNNQGRIQGGKGGTSSRILKEGKKKGKRKIEKSKSMFFEQNNSR